MAQHPSHALTRDLDKTPTASVTQYPTHSLTCLRRPPQSPASVVSGASVDSVDFLVEVSPVDLTCAAALSVHCSGSTAMDASNPYTHFYVCVYVCVYVCARAHVCVCVCVGVCFYTDRATAASRARAPVGCINVTGVFSRHARLFARAHGHTTLAAAAHA